MEDEVRIMTRIRRFSRAERRKNSDIVELERRKNDTNPLEITALNSSRDLIINLRNPVVAENSFMIREFVERVLDPHMVERVIVDLKDVPFIDSSGLGVLVDVKKKVNRDGVDFFLTNPREHVLWLIDTLLLDRILPIL